MKKFEYFGIQVKQTPESKPFYLIHSDASKLLEWSDVPRKQENFLAGYQRQLDPRHATITEYFTHPDGGGNNIIPSSVIIAADENKIDISPEGQKGLYRIQIRVEDRTDEELLHDILVMMKSRLGAAELESIAIESESNSDSTTSGTGIVDELDEEEEIPPESYLSVIVKRLESAKGNLSNLDPSFRTSMVEYLRGVSKPGLILDGQHRVFGAKDVSGFGVELPVVLMPGLSYSEQVFHFYVLNNKAKPLNKTELRSIIATSLSKEEISNLYDRFKQVGVTAEETAWTYKMNTDSDSPFCGLVDFGLNPNVKIPIPENVAYQVVSKFIKINRKYRLLHSDIEEWGLDVTSGADYRLKLFYALWRAVKKKYPNAWAVAVTNGGGQILQKVNLLILQEFLLDRLVGEMPKRKAKGQKSPFADPVDLEDEVGYELAFLSEEFFTKEWKMKGLDTAAGHKAFRESVDEAVQAQSQNLGNRRLFKTSGS
jgi:hypothetical protein